MRNEPNTGDTMSATTYLDVHQAKMRGTLDSTGEMYFAGDWLLVSKDGLGGMESVKNFEWDERAARAAAGEL
jgi:hypothetical protein